MMSDYIPELWFGYDEKSDGVFLAQDGVVLWWEQTFDSVDQILPGLSGKTFRIKYGEPDERLQEQLNELTGAGDDDE